MEYTFYRVRVNGRIVLDTHSLVVAQDRARRLRAEGASVTLHSYVAMQSTGTTPPKGWVGPQYVGQPGWRVYKDRGRS